MLIFKSYLEIMVPMMLLHSDVISCGLFRCLFLLKLNFEDAADREPWRQDESCSKFFFFTKITEYVELRQTA